MFTFNDALKLKQHTCIQTNVGGNYYNHVLLRDKYEYK